MASGNVLGDSADVAAAGAMALTKLQTFAAKAAEEKAGFIRRRVGDQALQVSCACRLPLYLYRCLVAVDPDWSSTLV